MTSVSVMEPFITATDESKYKKEIQKLEVLSIEKDHVINDLRYQLERKDNEIYQLNMQRYNAPKRKGVSTGLFILVFFIALGLGGYNIYDNFYKPVNETPAEPNTELSSKVNSSIDSSLISKTKPVKKPKAKPKKNPAASTAINKKTRPAEQPEEVNDPKSGNPVSNKYRVTRNAFFYEQPDKNSKNNYYVTANADAVITALNEKDEFVYVEFINSRGKPVKGWLSKNDLSPTQE